MIDRIKQIVAQLIAEVAKTGIGNVYDYNQDIYAVRVQLQPSGSITGWIPLATHWCGNGFGLVAGPGIGDQVRIDFVDGQQQAALCGARFFSDSAPPPAVPSGELWIVHPSGSLLKFHNDGTVQLVSAGTLTSSAPAWNHTGPVNVTGTLHATDNITTDKNLTATLDINDQGGAKGTLQHVRDNYDVHTHGGVQPGSGNTGAPSNSL